jgi:2-C-methyl-D-erythritol 4-phosphate cytidylyltransferase/2-C-methyl-D-erythritol 2,4-cyclodiphosphate synthase
MSTDPSQVAAVIVAAGRGARAAHSSGPKQYAEIGGRPVLARAIEALATHPEVGKVLVVIHPDDRARYEAVLTGLDASKLLPPVPGAATRQGSVRCGLEALAASSPGLVLIHDAARPDLPAAVVSRVIAALATHDGAIPALPTADTLKRSDGTGVITDTVDRRGLFRAQTPQGFHFARILAAHRRAAEASSVECTDDAQVAELAGMRVALVEGAEANGKLTTAEDLAKAEAAWRQRENARLSDVRTGFGFDVHRFRDGDHLMLCGVRIPHERGVEGHSDADVGLHALTDALLGTIGAGDIGVHFPPSDPTWKGASSDRFVAEAMRLITMRGGVVANADVTILCEQPRIGPHREAMRARMAAILGIALDRVSVKATTTEGLGFTGRGEGLAAQAVVTVRLPPETVV